MGITKTQSPSVYTPGTPMTYTILLVNNGPDAYAADGRGQRFRRRCGLCHHALDLWLLHAEGWCGVPSGVCVCLRQRQTGGLEFQLRGRPVLRGHPEALVW